MANKKEGRRKLLKSIATGSSAVAAGKSLPESWSKPVVDAILLPSHAETTDSSGSAPGATTTPAATTTPTATTTSVPCCNIAGQYCDTVDATTAFDFIAINVEPSGNISVSLDANPQSNHPSAKLVTSVPCTGGAFTASDDYYLIIGSITCDDNEMSGQIGFLNDPISIFFTANKGGCR